MIRINIGADENACYRIRIVLRRDYQVVILVFRGDITTGDRWRLFFLVSAAVRLLVALDNRILTPDCQQVDFRIGKGIGEL